MNPEDIQKLLGGFATGTLTPAEQEELFHAALDNQQLFDALAREQSPRDLLREPPAGARVLAPVDTAPPLRQPPAQQSAPAPYVQNQQIENLNGVAPNAVDSLDTGGLQNARLLFYDNPTAQSTKQRSAKYEPADRKKSAEARAAAVGG